MKSSTRTALVIALVALLVAVLAAAVAIAVVYTASVAATDDLPTPEPATRINCFPEKQPKNNENNKWNVTKEKCDKRGCTFDEDTKGLPLAPPCYMHPSKIGYNLIESCWNCRGVHFYAKLNPISKKTLIFDPPIENVIFTAIILNDNHLQFKLFDFNSNRYEVPLLNHGFKPANNSTPDSATFRVEITSEKPFSFKVLRKSTGSVLFDTSMGGLVFSNRFLQLTTKLPSDHVFGLGEHEHPSLQHSLQYKTWQMFATDQPRIGEGNPLYGVHPMYMSVEDDGNTNGVFLSNSNAIEYTLIPAPGVIMRTIGGIFDFHLYTGPTPENVVQQHTDFVGRPDIPPYWALGFHLSRRGYDNLANMTVAVERTRQFGIPLDAIYADVDHLDGMKDFTINQANFAGLSDYLANERTKNGLRSVIILNSAIKNEARDGEAYNAWDVLNGNDTFVKWTNGSVLFSNSNEAFPDFFLNQTHDVWKDLIARHSTKLPFDGLWLDNNEPTTSFGPTCPPNDYDNPPYRFGINDKTLCMGGVQNNGKMKHYDVHSLYGWSQSVATKRALQGAYPGKRGFVLSRSTFASSGQYASHWLGDNEATWTHLRRSIIGMLEMNMFGIPHSGANICGYYGEATPKLCRRWLQLGAFYPYSRSYNSPGEKDKDPASFGPEVAGAARTALLLRYRLLPYIYTLFYWAHVNGNTVARPFFHEFGKEMKSQLWGKDGQFMLGPSVMVAPMLDDDSGGGLIVFIPEGQWLVYNLPAPPINFCDMESQHVIFPGEQNPIVFLRGGSILPVQQTGTGNIISTEFTRKKPFELEIVYDCQQTSTGSLFWDDGDSADTVKSGKYWLIAFTSNFDNSTGRLNVSIGHKSTELEFSEGLSYAALIFHGLPANPKDNYQIACYPHPCPRPISSTAAFDDKIRKWTITLTENQPALSTGFTVYFNFF